MLSLLANMADIADAVREQQLNRDVVQLMPDLARIEYLKYRGTFDGDESQVMPAAKWFWQFVKGRSDRKDLLDEYFANFLALMTSDLQSLEANCPELYN